MVFTEKGINVQQFCCGDYYGEKKLPIFIFTCPENLNPLPLWRKILHDLHERVTEDQQNISAIKHDVLCTCPQEIFAWGKAPTINLKQADLAEGDVFISHVPQALLCEVFEMTVAAKDRSSGREHALGTCCGFSSCEEDISLENSTQHSTSATSIKWKKANLIPKKPGHLQSMHLLVTCGRMSISCINAVHTTH